jgi:hypothetical protein
MLFNFYTGNTETANMNYIGVHIPYISIGFVGIHLPRSRFVAKMQLISGKCHNFLAGLVSQISATSI